MKMFLVHVTFCSVVIAAFVSAIRRHISADEPPLESIVEPEYTKVLTFSYPPRAVEFGRLSARSTTMTLVFASLLRRPSLSLTPFTLSVSSAISSSSAAINAVSLDIADLISSFHQSKFLHSSFPALLLWYTLSLYIYIYILNSCGVN